MATENPKRPPKRLFKYLTPEFARKAVTEGSFRIGTLHEYRKIEDRRMDRDEGKMKYHGAIVGFSGDQHQPSREMQAIFGTNLAGLQVGRVIVEDYHVQAPDQYLYCTAYKFNREISDHPDYGATIRIYDPKNFALALDRELFRLGYVPERQMLANKITYCEREAYFTQVGNQNKSTIDVPWEFIKPEDFRPEHEFRMAWPIVRLEKPLIITCMDAAQYCKIYVTRPE